MMMAAYWTLVAMCLLTVLTVYSTEGKVPKKMRQLYKQYKRQEIHDKDINTVRYLSAMQESTTSQNKLLFNLDALNRHGDTLVRAELHFYRRTIEVLKTIQIDVSEISPYYITLVQRQRLSPSGKGWQQMDITKTIRQCTNTVNSYNKLGVGFSDVNADMVAVPVNMPKFLLHHSLPFILLYSNNNRTLEMDQIANHTTLSSGKLVEELNSMIDPKSGKPSKTYKELYQRRKRSVIDNKVETMKNEMEIVPLGKDNWINVDDLYNELTNMIEVDEVGDQSRGDQSRGDQSRGDQSRGDQSRGDQSTGDAEEAAATNSSTPVLEDKLVQPSERTTYGIQYIPWPTKERSRKQKYRNKNKQLVPATWKDLTDTRKPKKQECGRKSLRINFEDIGWGERIIEPKKFDAFYCSGLCSFPYSYGKHLTNHATLQSLITSIQKMTSVPQPCCVPQKLQPVTLMFYDEYKNIVLKTYSDMLVESCVCR